MACEKRRGIGFPLLHNRRTRIPGEMVVGEGAREEGCNMLLLTNSVSSTPGEFGSGNGGQGILLYERWAFKS